MNKGICVVNIISLFQNYYYSNLDDILDLLLFTERKDKIDKSGVIKGFFRTTIRILRLTQFFELAYTLHNCNTVE